MSLVNVPETNFTLYGLDSGERIEDGGGIGGPLACGLCVDEVRRGQEGKGRCVVAGRRAGMRLSESTFPSCDHPLLFHLPSDEARAGDSGK